MDDGNDIEQEELGLQSAVFVNNKQKGIVKYIGNVHFAAGVYIGVECEVPGQGENDGSVNGQEYFRCKSKCGLLVPVEEVRALCNAYIQVWTLLRACLRFSATHFRSHGAAAPLS